MDATDDYDVYQHRVNEIWKTVALVLSGALMSLCAWGFTISHDAISRAEVEAQNIRLEQRVQELQIQVARISEHLGIPVKSN